MHLYRDKKNISGDRPHGINVPAGSRRLIKAVSGDTMSFTATVVLPTTREPLKKDDLRSTTVYVALAENRFSPVLWAGSTLDRWIVLDEYRNGLVHITIPRTVMSLLRRGSYSFSVVVDDGMVRDTQLTGGIQVEYEPTGSINDIPYRNDKGTGNPISLTPEIDIAAQENFKLSLGQVTDAVDALSRVLLSDPDVANAVFGSSDINPPLDDLEYAIHRVSQFVLYNDELRAKIPTMLCDRSTPDYGRLITDAVKLLLASGMTWEDVPCRPEPR